MVTRLRACLVFCCKRTFGVYKYTFAQKELSIVTLDSNVLL